MSSRQPLDTRSHSSSSRCSTSLLARARALASLVRRRLLRRREGEETEGLNSADAELEWDVPGVGVGHGKRFAHCDGTCGSLQDESLGVFGREKRESVTTSRWTEYHTRTSTHASGSMSGGFASKGFKKGGNGSVDDSVTYRQESGDWYQGPREYQHPTSRCMGEDWIEVELAHRESGTGDADGR